RVHHAVEADQPGVRHLAARAAHRVAGTRRGRLPLCGGVLGRGHLLPGDRQRADGDPGPARAALHLELGGPPPPCSGCLGRARCPMNDVILRAEDVHKSYDGLEVLRGVSIDVGRGEVKVIIGPSGSGKSTLLRCLAMLETPDTGDIYLEEERLTALTEKALAPHRSEIGMVFQRFNLFQNMTALDNVMCALVEVRRLPKREARERALEFLARVGLGDKASQYPDELSGGQQQRVAIARA